MSTSLIRTLATAAVFAAAASPTFADTGEPWVLAPDTGYGYTSDGKTLAYKIGTANAKELFKGAKKVPKNTLFFFGTNGQLYMRSGAFLEDSGHFKFGPDR